METAELREPIYLRQGETYDEEWEMYDEDDNPVDISDKSASLQLREKADKPVVATAVCTVTDNKVRIVISAEQTANLQPREYQADLRLEKDGVVDYPVEVRFVVERPITRVDE